MLTEIEGTYENGQITLNELPSVTHKTKVVVTFLDEKIKDSPPVLSGGAVRLGSLKGKLAIPEDFNEPLDDLNEYMY